MTLVIVARGSQSDQRKIIRVDATHILAEDHLPATLVVSPTKSESRRIDVTFGATVSGGSTTKPDDHRSRRPP